jgi:hypothetical protein
VVHDEPPLCPLCACPIDGSRMRPLVLPSDGEV